MNAKYDAGMTADFLDPAVNGTFAVRPERAFALTARRLRRQPDPVAVPGPRVSLRTTGMPGPAVGIDPGVQNLWGLTRRRALDYGRVTTAAC